MRLGHTKITHSFILNGEDPGSNPLHCLSYPYTGRSTDLKIVTFMGTEINFRFFDSKSSEWVYKQLF